MFDNDQIAINIACFMIGIFSGYKFKKPLKAIGSSLFRERLKQVLVVREDLKMGKGKIVAQCCHGTLLSFSNIAKVNPALCEQWEFSGQAKVVLKASNLEELTHIKKEAEMLGIEAVTVCDAGRTQVAEGTITVLAVGPDLISKVDKVTGHLKLL